MENMCTRFLVARKGDTTKALKMLQGYLEWCENDQVLAIRHKTGKLCASACVNFHWSLHNTHAHTRTHTCARALTQTHAHAHAQANALAQKMHLDNLLTLYLTF